MCNQAASPCRSLWQAADSAAATHRVPGRPAFVWREKSARESRVAMQEMNAALPGIAAAPGGLRYPPAPASPRIPTIWSSVDRLRLMTSPPSASPPSRVSAGPSLTGQPACPSIHVPYGGHGCILDASLKPPRGFGPAPWQKGRVIITLLADSGGRRLPRIGDPVPGDYDISGTALATVRPCPSPELAATHG
jgi:hypothetical protein